MIKISKAGSGTVDYLADAETAHNSNDLAFDTERLTKYLKEQGIKPDQMDFKAYEGYLNQENSHYEAKMSGGLAELWNIKYSKKIFSELKSGKSPLQDSDFEKLHGYKLKKSKNLINIKENQQTGLSMLSTVPKSVSIHFARGSQEERDRINSALEKTNEMMYAEYAKQLKPSCRKGEYQDFDPQQTKWLVMSFTHYEDRGLDPHLHKHDEGVPFAEFALYKHDANGNRIIDEKGNYIFEKKMLAIDPEQIFKRQLENSAMHDGLLNSELQKAGFKTEPMVTEDGFDTFRIAGYTRTQELSMSKRQAEIEVFIEEQKEKGNYFSSTVQAEAAFADKVRRNTQNEKIHHNATEILEIVKDEVNKNISLAEQENIDKVQKTAKQEYKEIDYKKILSTAGFETDGVIEETKLRKAIIQELKFSRQFHSVGDFNDSIENTIKTLSMRENGKDRIIKMDDGKFTRIDIVLNERLLKENINSLKDKSVIPTIAESEKFGKVLEEFIAEAKENKRPLKDGQLEACKNIIENKAVTLVIGDAGTGKTSSVIKFANKFHSENGKKVFGISTQTKTSKALTEANIAEKNCLNTKQFIAKAFDANTGEIKTKFLSENKDSVLIFDEAGMIGTEDYRKITDWVRKSNSQLLLVGDQKQLQSVSYGNAFVQIQSQLDKNDISRLQENTRQKNEVAKDIAEGYRDKDIDKVFNSLEKNNLLVKDRDSNKLADKLCADYLSDKEESKIIVCGLNSEIDYINDKIREALIKQGNSGIDYKNQVSIEVERKSGLSVVKQDRGFCKGDKIVFLQNFKDKNDKSANLFNNAEQGIIQKIESAKNGHFNIEVKIGSEKDGFRTVKFNSGEYNKFNHCFAISSHKSQGVTVKNTYHLGNPNTSSQKSYVDGSRHENQYKLYINENDIERYKKNAVKEAVKATTLNDSACQKSADEYIQIKAQQNRGSAKPMPVYMQKNVNKDGLLKHADAVSKKKQELEKEEQLRQYKEKEARETELLKVTRKQEELRQKFKLEEQMKEEAIAKASIQMSKDLMAGLDAKKLEAQKRDLARRRKIKM
jgi:ATP-dependent exoDNAse (exonuclease V) alpha subunit